jgi:hypothetical protein
MKCVPGCTCRRHIGHPQSAETRAAISRGHLGQAKSAEHRAKLATATRAVWARATGPAANLGVKFTAEARANMSRARLGNTNARTHGGVRTREHNSWRDMLARCYRRSSPNWQYYGGRGVSVCERWCAFANFLVDMGPRPEGMTLDRIDPHGNYEPSNCRWATPKQQRANHRRTLEVTP